MVSKAFEKSNERTTTYGSVVSRLMTVFIREMMAAVGEPVRHWWRWRDQALSSAVSEDYLTCLLSIECQLLFASVVYHLTS